MAHRREAGGPNRAAGRLEITTRTLDDRLAMPPPKIFAVLRRSCRAEDFRHRMRPPPDTSRSIRPGA